MADNETKLFEWLLSFTLRTVKFFYHIEISFSDTVQSWRVIGVFPSDFLPGMFAATLSLEDLCV
jgi:hypothetical protein